MILGLLVLAIGVLAVAKISDGSSDNKRLYNLPDISPDEQGGTYKKDYDIYFDLHSDQKQVPFALLKAHAIVESSLNEFAFLNENPRNDPARVGWASRGLMQILWWKGSNRWARYGYPDSLLGDGQMMFEPNVNVDIASQLIRDNLKSCGGNIRDAINMYNTGKKESQYKAPHNYVDKVLGHYETLIKRKVINE